jgi:hypothetical protein
VLWKPDGLDSRAQTSLGQFRNSPYGTVPAKPLAARRPKVPPATSYTFALFSIKNIHFYRGFAYRGFARRGDTPDTIGPD